MRSNFSRSGSATIPLIMLILAAITVAGGYFSGIQPFEALTNNTNRKILSEPQTPESVEDVTVNWKTYRNEKYGFEIKYPSGWTYRQFPDTGDGAGFRPLTLGADVSNEVMHIVARGTAENYYAVPFDEYVTKAAAGEIENYEKLNSIEKIITESGLAGYKTTWIYRSMQDNFQKKVSLPITYFDYAREIAGNKIKSIWLLLDNSNYEKIYDQMASTLKLVPLNP